jgi:hypothetical protein
VHVFVCLGMCVCVLVCVFLEGCVLVCVPEGLCTSAPGGLCIEFVSLLMRRMVCTAVASHIPQNFHECLHQFGQWGGAMKCVLLGSRS